MLRLSNSSHKPFEPNIINLLRQKPPPFCLEESSLKKLLGSLITIALICVLMAMPVYAQNATDTGDIVVDATAEISPLIAFIGLFVGIILAVFFPYMRKVWQGSLEASDWSNRYLLVLISGLGLCLITAFTLAPQTLVMSVPSDKITQGAFGLFLLNFAVGFGETSIIKEIFDFGRETAPKTTTVKSP